MADFNINIQLDKRSFIIAILTIIVVVMVWGEKGILVVEHYNYKNCTLYEMPPDIYAPIFEPNYIKTECPEGELNGI